MTTFLPQPLKARPTLPANETWGDRELSGVTAKLKQIVF
jgi:hypothetical protein